MRLGADRLQIKLKENSTIEDLIFRLGSDYGRELLQFLYDEKREAIKVLPIINKKKCFPTTVLEDGDEVLLLPPIAGG